jgi:predicted porin
MKKTAIAFALAGLVAAPAAFADTTVYGSARAAVNYLDDDADDSRTNWRVQNQSSRLGFRGAEDLGRGMSAIYHYEFGVNIAEGSEIGGGSTGGRLSYVGLKGGLGQISIGRQWNPYYFAVGGEVDVFNGDWSGNGYYQNGGFTRSNNMLYYATPAFFGGLTLYGTVEMDGNAGDSDMDAYSVSAIYDNGPLFVGAGWKQFSKQTGWDSSNPGGSLDDACGVNNGNFDGKATNYYGVQGRYNFAFGLNLSASYQYCDNGKSGNKEAKRGGLDVQGAYAFGNNTLRLGYFWVDKIDGSRSEFGISDSDVGRRSVKQQQGLIAGYQYRFSRRTRVWVEGGWTDGNSSNTDQFNTSIGMRHDF